MDLSEYLKSRRKEIIQLANLHGAKNIRIFGSVARGESHEKSDIDLLVEMEKGRSLLDLVALWQDLEDFLGRKVDILTDGGISPYLQDKIYREAVPL